MFAVTVVFNIHEGHEDAFLDLITENARLSRTTEPGCQQFDVCINSDDQGTVFLYEMYDDAAAFEAHMQTSHFKAFAKDSKHMVANKSAQTFAEVRQ